MNKGNTILIESDIQRIYWSFPNLLRMVRYQETDVINPLEEKEKLLKIYKEYLLKLVESGTDDITEYLDNNTLPPEITKHFDEFTKMREEMKKLAEEERFAEFVDPEEKWIKANT